MIHKRDLRVSLRELLEGTNVFSHVHIRGMIDDKGETLTIEYRKAEHISQGDFYFYKNRLEEKVKKVTVDYFFPYLSLVFESPKDSEYSENYRIIFKNHHKGYRNLTYELLKELSKGLSNKYLFGN